MALEEIEDKFVGVWKLDRSENFQEFLQEVGKSKINQVCRNIVEDGELVILSVHVHARGPVGVMSRMLQIFLSKVHKPQSVGLPLRKMASLAKPEMTISIENDNKIKIVMKTGFFTQEDCFHLDEEFLKEMQGTLMKATASYEDGMIKMINTPVDPTSKVKQQIVHRERVGDEIVLTLFTGNVVCKRYMKKIG